MKLTIRGYEPLIIPKEAIVPMQGSFGGQTPYIAKVAARWKNKSYIEKKLPLKILCLESIYDRAITEDTYQTYSDPMAGIGISARIFGYHRLLALNDFDESCVRVLKANYKVRCVITQDDILTMPLHAAGLVFLDFNDFTMKRCFEKYSDVMRRAFEVASKFLVINDCSLFYLRYGKVAFDVYSRMLGKKITSVEDYFRAVASWYKERGWYLVQASYFTETSFLLLSRKASKLVLKQIRPEDIPSGMIKVETD